MFQLLTVLSVIAVSAVVNSQLISQWASQVTSFSSQADTSGWAANKCLGPPDVYPQYGDIIQTWEPCYTPTGSTGLDFIEIEVTTPVYISSISTFETWHSGHVSKISALRPDGTWQLLWNGFPSDVASPMIFSPSFEKTTFKTKAIRLDINCTGTSDTTQIDAIQVNGTATNPLAMSAYFASSNGTSNVRLNIPSIGTFQTKTNIECGSRCALTNGCESFNFQSQSHACELLNVTDVVNLMQNQVSWQYYYIFS